MSQANVETVLRCYAACNRHDGEAAVADFHPEAEYRLADALDVPLLYRGRAAIRGLFHEMSSYWEGVVSEPAETFDLGDHVLVRAVEQRVGRAGIAIELGGGGHLWKLDGNGLITNFESFDSWDEALTAARQRE